MSFAESANQSVRFNIDHVPDWREEPFTLIRIPGMPMRDVSVVNLNYDQTRALLAEGPNGRRQEYSPTSLLEKYAIDQYDPNAYMDLMCALAAGQLRNLREVIHLITAGAIHLENNPLGYTFPSEKYGLAL